MTKYNKEPDPKTTTPKITKSNPKYLKQINPYVAGIDIGSRSHFVAATVSCSVNGDIKIEVREFSSFTTDLEALADWLETCSISSVAMESTGTYWL